MIQCLQFHGKPYDTLDEVIGIRDNLSSLQSFGIKYKQIELKENNFDKEKIIETLKKEKVKLAPLLHGGGQQYGIRSGTYPVPGIAGIGEAAAQAYENLSEKTKHLHHLKNRLLDQTADLEAVLNGNNGEESAPHIVNLSFPGVRSEVLLHALEEYEIYVSAGSACASSHPEPSETLQALHLDAALAESALRFSFCSETQEEQIDYAAAKLKEIVPRLRKYTRR